MMKKIYALAMALSSVALTAQVGIDTDTPQQMLHVSGAAATDANGVQGPTIRVDGLNETNNPSNNGDLTPVYVNEDGDFVLRETGAASGYGYKYGSNLPGDDIASPGVIISYRGEDNPVVRNVRVIDFTLPATSLVHFNKTITFNFAATPTTPLNDGRPRFADSEWVISQAPTNTLLGKIIARDGVVYTSSGPGEEASQSGHLWATSHESVILPAGNYRVRLNVRVYGYAPFTGYDYVVQTGGGDADEISIIAEPWPY